MICSLKSCAGFVYIAWHPDAREGNGFYTKIGFSRSDPTLEQEHKRLGRTYISRNSRYYAAIFTLDAFGLNRLNFCVSKHLDHARCQEKAMHAKYIKNRRKDDCGASTEVFNVEPDIIAKDFQDIFIVPLSKT